MPQAAAGVMAALARGRLSHLSAVIDPNPERNFHRGGWRMDAVLGHIPFWQRAAVG